MKVFTAILRFRTNGPSGIYDLTDALRSVIKASGIEEGVAWVSAKGATPALLIVRDDAVGEVVRCVEKLFPAIPPGEPWEHGNAYAHLRSTVLSTLKAVPILGGEPSLPQGYGLYFLETRPVQNHLRQVVVQVHGLP